MVHIHTCMQCLLARPLYMVVAKGQGHHKVAPKYLFCRGNSCNKANKQTKAPFCAKMSLVGVVNPVCFLLFKK